MMDPSTDGGHGGELATVTCIRCSSDVGSVLHLMQCCGVRGIPVRVGVPDQTWIENGWAICLEDGYVRVQDMKHGDEVLCPVDLVQIQE